eukprot:scaffold2015_cov125-Skeletonema_dohrnii-CCMP3373.AAC.7
MNWDADAAIGDDAAHDTVDGERMTRLAAAPLLTTTTTRVVSVLGVEPWTRVEHTFSFDKLMDDIYNVVMQYYDANRNIEAFDGVTKEQGLINLLSLPGDQFNVVFNGGLTLTPTVSLQAKISSGNMLRKSWRPPLPPPPPPHLLINSR